MKKWTKELAIERGAQHSKFERGGWAGYVFENRFIAPLCEWHGDDTGNTFDDPRDFPKHFATKEEAFRWLIKGDRPVEKKKAYRAGYLRALEDIVDWLHTNVPRRPVTIQEEIDRLKEAQDG